MPTQLVVILVALAVVVAAFLYLFRYPDWRREKRLRRKFPTPWRQLLREQVPIRRHLPTPLRRQHERHVQLFLAEKSFYGCDGFEINDRVRLTIAGHACLLLLARPFSDYDSVRSILVYPDLYRVQGPRQDGFVADMEDEVRAGESSSQGQVVLAWSDCQEAVHGHGPYNVILHEFAHQLDYLDGAADGAPPLAGNQARQWQQTMSRAYRHLQETLRHGGDAWLDPYGASDPAEFFAVLTETFFQQPGHLQAHQPDVYRMLCHYYRLDPLEHWGRTP